MTAPLILAVAVSLLAAALTWGAVRGESIVFRLVCGMAGLVVVLFSLLEWMSFGMYVFGAWRGNETIQLILGWDPRMVKGPASFFITLVAVTYLGLIMRAGERHRQKRSQDRN